jgi:transcriptional regulator with XRE-family HTH domain
VIDKSRSMCHYPRVLHRGDAIRKLRLAQGLTIPQLAKAAQLNPKTVSKIERRAVKVSADTLAQIAHALGRNYDSKTFDQELDAWCHARVGLASLKPAWRALIEQYEELSDESQHYVLLVMRRELRLAKSRRAVDPDPASTAAVHPPNTSDAARQREKTGDRSDDTATQPSTTSPVRKDDDDNGQPGGGPGSQQRGATLDPTGTDSVRRNRKDTQRR